MPESYDEKHEYRNMAASDNETPMTTSGYPQKITHKKSNKKPVRQQKFLTKTRKKATKKFARVLLVIGVIVVIVFSGWVAVSLAAKPQTEPEPELDEPDDSVGEVLPEIPVSPLREEDGVTYLKIEEYEMILVNKEYSVPSDYGSGITEEAQQAFDSLKNAAAEDGYSIYVGSDYRSYETQKSIYNNKVAQRGEEEASRWSAKPGHSEHQLGLAFDVYGADYSHYLEQSFDTTPEFAWLKEHAAEYGFIIRYPKDKEWATGYGYEPWHIRYVGIEIAGIISKSGLCVEEYANLV